MVKIRRHWNYDVVLFGIQEKEEKILLEKVAVTAIKDFINNGGGCILINFGDTNFSELKENFGFKIGKWNNNSSEVNITKIGLLTTYPWKIGDLVPKIPTTSNADYKNNRWLELCDGDYKCVKNTEELQKANYSDNFNLSINNNCAIIQVDHSNNVTTSEKKIIANLIFYLYNLKKED